MGRTTRGHQQGWVHSDPTHIVMRHTSGVYASNVVESEGCRALRSRPAKGSNRVPLQAAVFPQLREEDGLQEGTALPRAERIVFERQRFHAMPLV
jgi:hypothetical protein